MNRLLHLLPPEIAHTVTIQALKYGLGPRATADHPALRINLLGKTFSNPIGLSAGADKKAEALAGWSRMGFGFVEAGTVILHPRAGNPKPRIWRLGGGHMVNWLGLPGDGLPSFLARLKKFQNSPQRKNLVVGASVASPDGIIDEFRQLAAACAPLVDYLTLNTSCPNLAHDTHSSVLVDQAKEQVKAVVAEAGGCPVLLKLGPTRDAESLRVMVTTAIEAGASGIVVTNTAPYDKKELLGALPFDWPEYQGQKVGGYSGPALLETTCWMVEHARKTLGAGVPIIGVGGIQSAADAARVINAGADAIQLYTGLIYRGKNLLDDIKQSLLKAPQNQ